MKRAIRGRTKRSSISEGPSPGQFSGLGISRRSFREEGVALVVTLIMLAVITFMAITFLVLSRSEKSNVTTSTDQALARLAADAGLERAQAQLLTSMLASSNEFN